MEFPTQDQLTELLDAKSEHCISIYIPTHRSFPETQQDPVLLKNVLSDIEDQLRERGLSAGDFRPILEPAYELLKGSEFWKHQGDCLALFLADGFTRVFRLPEPMDKHVSIGQRFDLLPLIRLRQLNGQFYVLAVSQNACRLFTGDRVSLEEIKDDDLPDDLRSTLRRWSERELNLHSMQAKPQTRGGDDMANYHGHFEDNTKQELEKYFREVDAAVAQILKPQRVPLIFAGVDYLFPIYQNVNSYPELCETPVEGNFDEASSQELHQAARPLIDSHLKQRTDVVTEYGGRAAQGVATDNLGEILSAAQDGLIDMLAIAEGADCYGRVDEDSREIHWTNAEADDAENLCERAARQTLENSGEVLVVNADQLPQDASAIAFLRSPKSAIVGKTQTS